MKLDVVMVRAMSVTGEVMGMYDVCITHDGKFEIYLNDGNGNGDQIEGEFNTLEEAMARVSFFVLHVTPVCN